MKRPVASPRTSEPGSMPVEPDFGPVPVLVPDEREEQGVTCPAVHQAGLAQTARCQDH